jgi:hypothetical protein
MTAELSVEMADGAFKQSKLEVLVRVRGEIALDRRHRRAVLLGARFGEGVFLLERHQRVGFGFAREATARSVRQRRLRRMDSDSATAAEGAGVLLSGESGVVRHSGRGVVGPATCR